MPDLTITLAAKTATTAQFTFTNLAADGTIELQISPRADFQFCVCPIAGIANASPYTANGLNQDATYYARARPLRASGARENWSNTIGFKTPVSVAQDHTVPSIVVEPAILMKPETILAWTPGNEVAGYPAKNVSKDSPVAWHSVAAGGAHSIVLQHSGAPIDTIAFLNTNLPEATTVTVRGANTLAGIGAGAVLANAVPFRASANVPGRCGYHGLVLIAPAVEHPFIGIYLTTAAGGAPGNMIHVEHILIGRNRMTKNFALESTETAAHLGTKERTRSGVPDMVRGMKMRRAEFELAFLTETQSETMYRDVWAWLDEAIFAVPNSKAGPYLHDRMLYGDFKGGRLSKPTSIHATRAFTIDSII